MSKITPPEMGSYAGGVVAIGTSLTLTQVGIIVGIVTALLTFVLNAWYTAMKNAREQKLIDHQVRLAELEEQERVARLSALGVKL